MKHKPPVGPREKWAATRGKTLEQIKTEEYAAQEIADSIMWWGLTDRYLKAVHSKLEKPVPAKVPAPVVHQEGEALQGH
jgi:hypothetical protein